MPSGENDAVAGTEAALVGRDDIVDELVAAASHAARGAGSIALLTGEAGIGKTSVARVLARRVGDQLAVSWGACVADQSAPPFWPWRTLVPVEAPDASISDDAVGAPRYERLLALRERIRADAADRPRLHIIEDLQWADVGSVLLLADVGAAIADTPLLVIATLRTGEPRSAQLDDALAEVQRTALTQELVPFDQADVEAVLRGAHIEPEDDVVALVLGRTGGNPLFVSELLRSAPVAMSADRQRQLLAQTVPTRVADLLEHRLRRLPVAVSDVLVTASVIGAEGDIATLAAAHACEIDPLLELLDQARAAHVVDTVAGRWQFRHQLLRDAVYASATERTRARRHAAVLDALVDVATTAPPVVAHHALAAQPLVDVDRAVALAARAGQVAFAQQAYEAAVDWFTRALATAPAATLPRWRAELLVLCGEAHRHIGEVPAAREAFLAATELTDDPALLARAALGYADPGADLGIAYRAGELATAALLERAIDAQARGDSETSVRLDARLAAELHFSDEPARARALADRAVDAAVRIGDPGARTVAGAVVHDAFVVGQAPMETQLAGSAELLDRARASGSVGPMLTAHRARVIDLLAAGDLSAMDAEVLAFRRLAEPLRTPAYQWWPTLWSAMRALLEGRHQAAEERALAAFQIGERSSPALSFFNLSFLLFFLRREQGRLAEMEQATRDYAASHSDVPALRVALALLLAELGRLEEARAALAAFDGPAVERLHDRNWPASWFQLARATFLAGDAGLAAALLDGQHRPHERCIQVSLGTVCLGAADLGTAWLLHTSGDLDAADEHYRSAEALNARIGARSWLAQAQADHARLLSERDLAGDQDASTRLLGLARDAARAIGLATVDRPTEAAPATTFRREGAVWLIAYGHRTAQLPDGRGLRDLAELLARPGEAISVLELAHDPDADQAGIRGAPALDERARRQIRARLQQLDADEADADASGDGERAALVREERQALAEAFARDFGLGGRARRVGDPVERARKTVSTRIRRAIATIGRAHPELGRHLERSIDTGAWCAYRPAEPVDWRT